MAIKVAEVIACSAINAAAVTEFATDFKSPIVAECYSEDSK